MRLIAFLSTILNIFYVSDAYDPYPYNPTIHTLGNHGLWGKIHARMAPWFTRYIDRKVYGKNIRKHVLETETANKRCLDIGCGVGFSTSSSDGSIGIDTSEAMIDRARRVFPNKKFAVGHGEYWDECEQYDIVTVMYLFHEAPQMARKAIFEHAKSIAKEKVIIVDIAPDYTPSHSMLMGEPYVTEYLEHIQEDLSELEEHILVPGHVHMWVHECGE